VSRGAGDEADSVDRVDELESALSAAVLSLLRGVEPAPPSLPPRRALEERAGDGDVEALPLLRAHSFFESLPTRIERALGLERAPVLLADGSTLSLDEAERLLAKKEERRAHPALRGRLDATLASFRQFHIDGTSASLGEARRERARACVLFLDDTAALRDAALEVLATLGGEPPEGPAALARALDLPDVSGAFGEAATSALVAAAREAPAPAHRVSRFRAPRQLAGVALAGQDAGGERVWHLAQPPLVLRFDRHRRTVAAAAVALSGSRRHAPAFALGLLSAPPRRALGAARSDAERAARIGAATTILHARALAALASLGVDGGLGERQPAREAAREAAIRALGSDPGPALLEEKLTRAWTLAEDDPLALAAAWLEAGARAEALRERFDEAFPLRRDAWRQVGPVEDGEDDGWAAACARGWRAWAGALL
jgi:hypothetical protein